MSDSLIVQKKATIRAGVSDVWQAITDPELTRKYMYNSEVISGWKTGSMIEWRDADSGKVHVRGIILGIEPGKRLQTSDLSIDAGLPDIPSNYSRVTYELKEQNGTTVLTVTEDSFNGDEKRYHDASRFWENVLKVMKALLEQ